MRELNKVFSLGVGHQDQVYQYNHFGQTELSFLSMDYRVWNVQKNISYKTILLNLILLNSIDFFRHNNFSINKRYVLTNLYSGMGSGLPRVRGNNPPHQSFSS